MDLREYLFRHRMTQETFAQKIGSSRRYVSVLVRQKYHPSVRLAKDIEIATGGEVTAAELRPEKKIA